MNEMMEASIIYRTLNTKESGKIRMGKSEILSNAFEK